MPAQSLPRLARLFVAVVVAAGGLVILHAARALAAEPVGYAWLALALLTAISSVFPVRVPGMAASLSMSEAFVFSSLFLFGPAPAILTVAADGLVLSLVARRKRLHRMVFNTAQPALSVWAASQVLLHVAPGFVVDRTAAPLTQALPGLLLFTLTYFVSNSGLNAIAVGLASRTSIPQVWWELRSVGVNSLGGIAFATLLSESVAPLNVVALAALPVLLATFYITFRHSMTNAEEARSHLERINKLYLSTIETLAMAIDAKDQVTHGHIRRVQLVAVGLAKALGVKDSMELKAIEAAALLHDMGKLAIPEHILNKPGKLSKAEFEQMKQHASIGADILARIDFPYPVVPIVRHHHEHWDGNGYPDGIAGEAIPIGARILSVVDCYDALTSDRPYRRALSDHAALDILLERRGTTYDPRVVDTFVSLYQDLRPDDADLPPGAIAFDDAPAASASEGGVMAAEPSDPATVPEGEVALAADGILEPLLGTSSLRAVTDRLTTGLQRHMPIALCGLYVYDDDQDDLLLACATGAAGPPVEGLRIALGDRLTGWVGSNRRTIRNSDGSLDFIGAPVQGPREIRSCLSAPLVSDGALVGVLTLYATRVDAYSIAHQALVERLAGPLSHLVRVLTHVDTTRAAAADALLGTLPGVESDVAWPDARQAGAVVVIDARQDPVLLGRAALALRRALRDHGQLRRGPGARLVALLPGNTRRDAEELVSSVAPELLALSRNASPRGAASSFAVGVSDTRFCHGANRMRLAYEQAGEALCPLEPDGRAMAALPAAAEERAS